ncbi:hypothetical protein [Klebsiella phage vB_KpnP_ZX1]|nr:hypothetical protein [Klebsiella phage vB_KpnP_ZX1]
MEKLPELHCQCGATPKMNITSEGGKTKYYVSCSACGRSGPISKQPARAADRWNEKG